MTLNTDRTLNNSPRGQEHVPVLLQDVIDALNIQDNGIYVDGTFGRGGYTRAILDAADCTVYAIDRDPDAIMSAADMTRDYPDRFTIIEGTFGNMVDLLKNHDVNSVDGITLDLGVSSAQVDQAERGFSFNKDGPLDMRMSKSGMSAADIVNTWDEEDIANIIYQYGEEHKSRYIARAIVTARDEKSITRTSELAELVAGVVRKKGRTHPATKTFQALRIAVNAELDELNNALKASENLLNDNGRLAVVSFHSLEDRAVKQFMRDKSGINDAPQSKYRPPVKSSVPATFELVKKSAIKADQHEMDNNPRARSARLRVANRIRAGASS